MQSEHWSEMGVTEFGWFPSPGLGTNCWQAPACRLSGSWSFQGRVPKLELGNEQTAQRTKNNNLAYIGKATR